VLTVRPPGHSAFHAAIIHLPPSRITQIQNTSLSSLIGWLRLVENAGSFSWVLSSTQIKYKLSSLLWSAFPCFKL
jgi:hypothetical protein